MVDFHGCLISNHVLKQRYLTLSYTLCGGGNRLCVYIILYYYILLPYKTPIQNTDKIGTKEGRG